MRHRLITLRAGFADGPVVGGKFPSVPFLVALPGAGPATAGLPQQLAGMIR